MSTYSTDVLATTGLLYYWQLKEPSGTNAADSQGTNTGTYQPTVTLGQTGIPGESPDPAVRLNGSTGYVSTTTGILNPTPFSLECWFKTANAYASGGPLFQFNNGQTALGGSFDRYLWMDNGGLLHYAAGVGTPLASSLAYNDGNYHHVVVTQSGATAVLYVDGSQVATGNPGATSSYTGFWHIGNGATGGFAPTPTSGFIGATLAHAAVYSAALSSATVLDHYQAGTLTGPYAGAASVAAFSDGFRRESDDSLTVTSDATGALYLDGFLRSPTGALVVTTSTAGATMQDDFLRAPNGALVVNSGGAGTKIAGFLRDTNLALVTASSAPVTGRVAGFTRDASGRLSVTGIP